MDLTAEIQRLQGLFNDLSAQVSRLNTAPSRSSVTTVEKGGISTPYYVGTQIEGGTYTLGTDWSPQFDDRSATNWRQFDLATACGSFEWGDANASFGTRFVISWDNPNAQFTVGCYMSQVDYFDIGGTTSGPVQVNMNGVRTEHTVGPVLFSLDVKKGVNRLVIVRAEPLPDSVQFGGILFEPDQFIRPVVVR